MFATVCRSVVLVCLIGLPAAVRADNPMHQKRPVKLLAAADATYRIVQQDQEIGREHMERRVYDDNTVIFDVESSALMGGATYSFKSSLVLDEESYFPRSYRSARTIAQPVDTLEISYAVDMFSNVAVVGSDMQGRTDSRRVVVPVGVPLTELGAVYSWYQILFWTDFSSRDRQRFQWLDPQRGVVESGEIYLTGEQTLEVMGKKMTVSVLKAERERLGSAILYVDDARRIVRCEQNITLFELVEWSEK